MSRRRRVGMRGMSDVRVSALSEPMGRGGAMSDTDTSDAQKLAELVIDLEKGLRFIREAQGYGRVTVTLEVRKGGIAMWEVSQAVTRKARAADNQSDIRGVETPV